MWKWIWAVFAKVPALTYLPVHADFVIFFPFWEGGGGSSHSLAMRVRLSPGLGEVGPQHIFEE